MSQGHPHWLPVGGRNAIFIHPTLGPLWLQVLRTWEQTEVIRSEGGRWDYGQCLTFLGTTQELNLPMPNPIYGWKPHFKDPCRSLHIFELLSPNLHSFCLLLLRFGFSSCSYFLTWKLSSLVLFFRYPANSACYLAYEILKLINVSFSPPEWKTALNTVASLASLQPSAGVPVFF